MDLSFLKVMVNASYLDATGVGFLGPLDGNLFPLNCKAPPFLSKNETAKHQDFWKQVALHFVPVVHSFPIGPPIGENDEVRFSCN